MASADLDAALQDELERAWSTDEKLQSTQQVSAEPQTASSSREENCTCASETQTRNVQPRRRPDLLLQQLPTELLTRILSVLSPDDLTVAAKSCQLLSTIASSDSLWRRLFVARWGENDEEGDTFRAHGLASWKRRYMDKDQTEGAETCAEASGMFLLFCQQMAVSKRTKGIGLFYQDDNVQVSSGLGRSVSQWRFARGLQNAAKHLPGAKHSCSGRTTFSCLKANVFLCDVCGWAHICGHQCAERVVQSGSNLPVCPISGRCFERMMSEWEEVAEGFQDGEEKAEEVADGFIGPRASLGRLGNAYLDGYNCATEAELRRAVLMLSCASICRLAHLSIPVS